MKDRFLHMLMTTGILFLGSIALFTFGMISFILIPIVTVFGRNKH